MNMKKVLRGRSITKGIGEGEALVTKEAISFNAGVNPDTGIVVEYGHELQGSCISGKVLVFSGGKGSTGGSWTILRMADQGTAPVAMINVETEPIVAVGAIVGKIPLVDKLDQDPTRVIKTGDSVKVDANKGEVIFYHK